MRRLPFIFLAVLSAALAFISCNNEDVWKEYEQVRNDNLKWLAEQVQRKDNDGKDYYKVVRAAWNKDAYVLMRFFNDTLATEKNLQPYYNSVVDVKYHGRLYNDEPFDSSYLNTVPADSIFRTRLTDVVSGWAVALTNMHVGDSCEIIIPFDQGYGSEERTGIPPYSMLVFGVKLVGIPGLDK